MKLGATAVLTGVVFVSLVGAQAVSAQTGAVRAAVDASNKKFGAAIAAGNAAGVAALYTEDAVVLPPNAESVTGRPAIEKFFLALIAGGVKGATLTAKEVEAHGETATEVGAYSIADAAGKELDRGKYIVLWKRVKGEWKLHRDIFNSSMPPMAAPK
jgi:uncharacterized protein (TIGR02246 family)